MKITYIHQHYSQLPAEGGLSRPWQFARRLAADGHEVTLIAGSRQARTTYVEGVRIVHVRAPYANAAGPVKRILAFLLFVLRATLLAVRTPADVVFASSTPLTVAVPGMIGALTNRARFVFEVRDLWPTVPIELGVLTNPVLRFLARALERLTYRRADTVIALSDDMAAGVRSVNPTVPVVVIPNASDFSLFPDPSEAPGIREEQGWAPDETVLVYAGSFGRIYNLAWVVDLAAALRSHGVRVVMYGNGGSMPALRQRAREHGLDVDALLPGRVRRQDLARVLAAADATISSVLRLKVLEPASINKVFESMAAQKPVLFNHDGWLTELMTKHHAGWRLDDDPARAALQLQDIVARPAELREAGERSAELGRERFDRDKLYVGFRAAVVGA